MLSLLLASALVLALPAAAQPRKAAAPPALVLEGVWVGDEVADVGTRHPTVTFTKDGGTLAYEDTAGGTGSMTLRLQAVKVEAGTVRFAVPGGGKLKHFIGRWDGRRITGTIAADASGQPQIGTFALRRPVYEDAPIRPSNGGGSAAGEPSPAGAASTAAPAPGAAPSETESARQAGRQRLEQRLSRISEEAGQLLQAISEWQGSCFKGGTPLYDQPAVDCDAMIREVGRLAVAVGHGLDEAEEEARRSWVEPGTVRELRDQYGLGHSKWDELSSRVRQLEAEWRQGRR
jgi:hypothetical protein